MLPSLSSASSSEPVNFIAKQKKGETKPAPAKGKDSKKCFCCGRSGHISAACRYKAYKCNICGQSGHLQKVCKSAGDVSKNPSVAQKKNNSDKCNFVQESEEIEELSDRFNHIFVVHDPSMTVKSLDEPVYQSLIVEKSPLKFEVDTGSSITAISTRLLDQLDNIRAVPFHKTSRVFRSYTEEKIVPSGVINVRVDFKGKSHVMELFVLPSVGTTPILGRRWLRALNLLDTSLGEDSIKCFSKINVVTENSSREIAVREFPTVFTTKLGTYTKGKFSLELKPN